MRTAFSEVGRRLSAARTPEAAARLIVAVAQDLVGWDACSLDLYFPESGTLQAILSMDRIAGRVVDVPHVYAPITPGSTTARVLQEGGQLILREAGQPSDALIPFGDTGRLSASLIFVPIRHSDRINGVLSIQSYTPQAYDRSDLDTVQALADHCGGALERLRIEEALRESQAQLARTEAVSLVMTAHVGLDDRWLKVPPMLCRLLDYGEEELLRMRLDDVIHPEDLESGATQRRRLVQGEARSFDLEMRCLTRAGRTIWMYLNCSVVQDVHGRPLYFLAYLRDITDRKSLEDQLRQAQKMEAVGQLAGGIAHDFNNLLTAILGHGELLLAEIGPEDPRRADVTEITRAAHRAAALTRQ
nr:PAS domain S-box protein [Gemmatimonadales bacterium]